MSAASQDNIARLPRNIVTVVVSFWDAASGGNKLAEVSDGVRLLREAPPSFSPTKANLYDAVKEIFHPATNDAITADDANDELDVTGGGATAELVLRAVARTTSASGLEQLVLPETYTDYEYLELIISDPGAGAPNTNTASTLRIRTDWLALQNDADAIKIPVLDTDEAGSRQWLLWTPSTRTLARGAQSNTTASTRLRIQAARLFDSGPKGPKGDKGDQGANGAAFITNIAAYSAANDRFEDSSNAAVVIPTGSFVFLTKAVYDAAVADSFGFASLDAVFVVRAA